MLTDLKEIMPHAAKWGDVVRLVQEKETKTDPAGLVVYQRPLGPLENLSVGAKQ